MADSSEETEFTVKQYEKTREVVEILKAHYLFTHGGGYGKAGNYAIWLKSLPPCRHETIDLRPAMSLQTRVVNILNVQKGETVGYGRVWTADRDSVIAVLGIGYADGLMRCLSGVLPVLISGKRVKQVGRICMDMCIVDVTDIPKPQMRWRIYAIQFPMKCYVQLEKGCRGLRMFLSKNPITEGMVSSITMPQALSIHNNHLHRLLQIILNQFY